MSKEKKPNTYLFDFQHQGRTFGFELLADTEQEAQEKLESIKQGAYITGVLSERIPVPPAQQERLKSLFRKH